MLFKQNWDELWQFPIGPGLVCEMRGMPEMYLHQRRFQDTVPSNRISVHWTAMLVELISLKLVGPRIYHWELQTPDESATTQQVECEGEIRGFE